MQPTHSIELAVVAHIDISSSRLQKVDIVSITVKDFLDTFIIGIGKIMFLKDILEGEFYISFI